jgi:hypothetical protein
LAPAGAGKLLPAPTLELAGSVKSAMAAPQ